MANRTNANEIKFQRELRHKGVQKLKSKEKECETKLKAKEKNIRRLEKENKCNKLKCKELKKKCDRVERGHEEFIRLCENNEIIGNVDC